MTTAEIPRRGIKEAKEWKRYSVRIRKAGRFPAAVATRRQPPGMKQS